MVQARLVDLIPDPELPYHPKLALGPGNGVVLAFSLGAETVIGGLVDAAGNVHYKETAKVEVEQFKTGPTAVMRRIRGVGLNVLRAAFKKENAGELLVPQGDREVLKLMGVTAAFPCPMDRDSFPVRGLPPDWHGRSLRGRLRDVFGDPLTLSRVHAMNDANAGALTMAFGWDGDEGDETVMCLHLAAGIGLGTVHMPIPRENELPMVRAHLVGGHAGVLAGEIGHRKVDRDLIRRLNDRINEDDGIEKLSLTTVCPGNCGPNSRTHLEAVVGARAVLNRLENHRDTESLVYGLLDLHDAADRGDENAIHVLKDVGRVLARSLDGIVAANDPAKIKLTAAMACDSIVAGMRERVESADEMSKHVEIDVFNAKERPYVALRGAALAALRAGLYRGFFNDLTYTQNVKDTYTGPDPWSLWTGWDHQVAGVQTGQMQEATTSETDKPKERSGWEYKPLDITEAEIDELASDGSSTPKARKTTARPRQPAAPKKNRRPRKR